tara:strand:- start:2098 stop:2700 length:603 start_codon:yes stop_codon:yes gene_type:complete
MDIKESLLVFCLTILFPMFIAVIINTYYREEKLANLKLVYLKIFAFAVILFLASNLWIIVESDTNRFLIASIGYIFMFFLVLELFLIPKDDANINDPGVLLFHQIVFWIVMILLCVNFYYHSQKLPKLLEEQNIPFWRMDKTFSVILKKLSLHNDIQNLDSNGLLPSGPLGETQFQYEFMSFPLTNLFTGCFVTSKTSST